MTSLPNPFNNSENLALSPEELSTRYGYLYEVDLGFDSLEIIEKQLPRAVVPVSETTRQGIAGAAIKASPETPPADSLDIEQIRDDILREAA